MLPKLSILLLEDNPHDAELIRATLVSGGLNPVFWHADSGSRFEGILRTSVPGLIISDFSLPGYNGKTALAAAQRLCPDTPFIFYSGTMGEESAIEALKCGATDYVLKDKPKRLISAIQRALAESEHRRHEREADAKVVAQAQLLDLATDAIVVRDMEDRLQFWNCGAERLYGFTRHEIAGRTFRDFVAPNSQQTFDEGNRALLKSGEWQGEMEHLSKTSKIIVVMTRWTLVRDENGSPERVLTINTDITEKKALERQSLRAQRLETVGTLASGVAHDLNNVLAPIVMACDFLKDIQATSEASESVDLALKSALQGTDIVRQLLTFVRGGEGTRILVRTNAVLSEICDVLKKTLPRNISVECDIQPDLLPITADPTQLHQVLMNLCINARDAMPYGGKLIITATNITGSLQIRIKDTGTGIPPEILDRIFDPFFTTKEPGKGTGLGLSTVVGILNAHGGNLKVESTSGTGTIFEILLPFGG